MPKISQCDFLLVLLKAKSIDWSLNMAQWFGVALLLSVKIYEGERLAEFFFVMYLWQTIGLTGFHLNCLYTILSYTIKMLCSSHSWSMFVWYISHNWSFLITHSNIGCVRNLKKKNVLQDHVTPYSRLE